MKLDALVFDAYGTLFDVHSVAVRCEQLWPGRGEAVSRSWRSKQLEYTWLRTLMERYRDFEAVSEDALRYACAALALPCDAGHVATLMEEYRRLSPFPEVRSALAALDGMPLAILSNGTAAMLEAVVTHARLDGLLTRIISVGPLRRYKPDSRVYQSAVDALGVAKERIGFVSANGWDAAGAKAFGFVTCWINRGGAPMERLDVEPDRMLRSLAELPAFVA